MDTSGEQHLHIEHNIFKRRLDLAGNPIEDPKKEESKLIINTYRLGCNKKGDVATHLQIVHNR